MNLTIFSLIYLSILRLLYLPFFGGLSSLVSGGTSVILGLILLYVFKVDNSTLFIIPYSILLFFLTLFSADKSFFLVILSFFETLTPFLIIGVISSSNFKNYVNRNINFFKKGIILLFSILLFGQFLNLIGFPLPSLYDIPIVAEFQGKFSTNSRITSFVGTSGPFSLCMAFLLISLQILYSKYYSLIFIFGTLILLFSFSRLALASFIIFNFFNFIPIFIRFVTSKNLKIRKDLFFYLFFAISLVFVIVNSYFEQFYLLFIRFKDGLDFINDQGNIGRLISFKQLIFDIKENSFTNILIGDGTGKTSMSTSGFQGESQLGKIYVEWGLIGLSLVIFWILEISNILKFKANKVFLNFNGFSLAIFITLIFNLLFIQSFTSSPVFVSMIFPLIANNHRSKE